MTKQSAIPVSVAFAAAIFGAVASGVAAESVPPPETEHASPPSVTGADPGPLVTDAPGTAAREAPEIRESSRAEKLERLFGELAVAGPDDWEDVQNSILRLLSKSGSDSIDLLLRRGSEALDNGELVKALHHLTAVTGHAPEFAEGWNARATAYFRKGELGQSLADIERVLALEPRHFGALSGLAIILEQVGRPADALDAWRAAAAVHPNLGRATDALARLKTEVEGRKI